MARSKPKKLPKLLSEGLRLALKDLAWIEANPKYQINMGIWHTPRFESIDKPTSDDPYKQVKKFEVCEVCFAGSVIAHTMKCKPTEDVNLYHFSPAVRNKLLALDSIREGNISGAINNWYGDVESEKIFAELHKNPLLRIDTVYDTIKVEVTNYDSDPDLWWADMEHIADALEQLGL